MMLDAGLTQRQAVGILYLAAASLGVLAVVGGTGFKLTLFALLFIGMTLVMGSLNYSQKKHKR